MSPQQVMIETNEQQQLISDLNAQKMIKNFKLPQKIQVHSKQTNKQKCITDAKNNSIRTCIIKCQKNTQQILIKTMILFVIILLTITIINAFEFTPPSVTAIPLTINTLSVYEITIDRAYTSDLVETRWSVELVPSGSNITVVFPPQYTFTTTNQPKIDIVIIDGIDVVSPVMVRTDNRTLVITNAITSILAINTVTITISNVLNPSPAFTTSPFSVKVGNDFSSLIGDSNSIITLNPDQFRSCGLTFSPSTTNTSGDMIITVRPKTVIPMNGIFVIDFPVTLQWSEDVSLNHPLEIDKVSNCSVVSTEVSSVSCVGVKLNHEIIIKFTSSSFTSITKDITITIKGLFSPPTVNAPDTLKLSSLTVESYGLDMCSVRVTNLQPQTLNMLIESSSIPLLIDTWTTLSFNFSNTDTIARDDYFEIVFPSPTTISFVRSMSNLALTSGIYTASTFTLRFTPLSSATNINQNTSNYIRFLNYKAPLTTKQTQFIVLTVYSGGGRKKMEGRSKIKAVQRAYNITSQSGDSLYINDVTSYYLTVNVANTVTNKAMLKITLPQQLKMNNSSVCPKSLNTSASNSTTCVTTVSGNQTVITIKSLWNVIPTGQQRIQLPFLQNPGYSINLSQFRLSLYFNESEDYLVADYTSLVTDNLTILPKMLNHLTAKVQLNDYKVASNNVTYFVTFVIGNDLLVNGIVDLYKPITPGFLFAPGTGFQCLITYGNITDSVRTCSFNTTQKSIRVFTVQAISASTSIKFTLKDCCSNPYNTRPTSFIGIQTLTSTFNLIQYLDTPLPVSGFVSIPIKSQSIIRGSDTNSQANLWAINFELVQLIDQNSSTIGISFPLWTALSSLSSVKVSNMAVSENINFTISNVNKTVTLIIPPTIINSKQFTITMTNVINPPTFEPLTYQITTKTPDNYTYASSNFTLLPTLTPSVFASFSYVFGSRIIGILSTLVLTVMNRDDNVGQIGKLLLFNLSQYMEVNNTVTCDNSTVYTCSLSSDKNTLTILNINTTFPLSNPLTISLSNLYIRTSANFLPMTFSSFSINGFKASQFNNLDFGPLCTLPCKQCVSVTQLNKCTSCFETPTISLQKYLFNFSCYENCPNTTFKYFDISLALYQYVCQNCSAECLTCDILATNCTSCNVSSVYKFSYLSQCLQVCPNLTYPSTGLTGQPTCKPCVSPCLSCSSQTACTSCVASQFFYIGQCISSCPENTTIPNITAGTCDNCSKECTKCQNETTKCLQCATIGNLTYLYVQDSFTCVAVCPSDRVMDKTLKKCVYCEAPCLTCFGVENNCTSCVNGSFLSFTKLNTCVTVCEPLSYQNITSKKCQSCASVPSLHCKNCSSPTTCYQCDIFTVYVFFGLNSSCLDNVPSGYVNVSGVAVKCDVKCKQCTLTPITCSGCDDGLFLLNGQCKSLCGDGFVGLNGLCVLCQGGCKTCSATPINCTTCYNVYNFMNNTLPSPTSTMQNQCLIQCPSGYFHSSYNITLPDKTCDLCQAPCKTCENLTYCLSCVSGYIYKGQCYETCPTRSLSNTQQMFCKECALPCVQCVNETYVCTSCVNGYYFYEPFNRCYLPSECPVNVSISNNSTQTCQSCQFPCITCINSTIKCLSCTQSTLLYKQAYQCVTSCPSGYYSSFGECIKCKLQCAQCQSSLNCTKCANSYLFYEYQCLVTCPVAYSIVMSGSCTKCKELCLNCSKDNQCFQCDASAILLNGDCFISCPSSLIYVYNTSTNKRSCRTAQEMASANLQQALAGPSLSQILPLPFTIISSVIFAASIMSKIQYEGTYIFGWAYVVYGLAQVGSLGYFFYKFWFLKYTHQKDIATYSQLQYDFLLKLLMGCLGLIGILNFFSTTCGSFYLTEDTIFAEWMRIKRRRSIKSHKQLLNHQSSNQVLNASQGSISEEAQTAQQNPPAHESQKICCQPMNSFLLTTVFSLITTFKFRFILFSRLFDLVFFSAKLEDVQKFRFFNILTLLGFCYEGCGIFIMYKVLTVYESKFQGELLLTAIDCLSLLIVNIIVGVISMNKGSDFFTEDQQQPIDKDNNDQEKDIQANKITQSLALSSKRKLNQKNNNAIGSKNKVANTYDDQYLKNPQNYGKKTISQINPSGKYPNASKNDQKQPQLTQNKNYNSIYQVKNGKLISMEELVSIEQILQENDQNSHSVQRNVENDTHNKFSNKKNKNKNKKDNEYSPDNLQSKLKVKKTVSQIVQNKDSKINSTPPHNKLFESPPKNIEIPKKNIEKALPLIQETKRRKKPQKLLQHNICSTNNPVQQQMIRSKLAASVPEWQPKIKQARLKRQSLSQMDLIDLYNPNLEAIEQFRKSSSEFILPTNSAQKVVQNEYQIDKNMQEDFVQNKVGWLNKITEEPESLQANEQFKSKLLQLNSNFDNRTFEQGKLFSSNPNVHSPSVQKVENQRREYQISKNIDILEQSYEKILPFIHVEQTKELVQTKYKKNKKRKNPRAKFVQENKDNETKVRNIFDQSQRSHQDYQNSINSQISQDQNNELPQSSKKFLSFGH